MIGFTLNRDDAAGVYELWNGGQCVYVGQTANIFNRVGQHWSKDFDRIVFTAVAHAHDRLNLEERRIAELSPTLNRQLNGDRLAEDGRCAPHGERGRRLCGDPYADRRKAMASAIEAVGSQARLAEKVGCTQQSVSGWKRTGLVPAEAAAKIEAATGVSRQRLCPDVFGEAST